MQLSKRRTVSTTVFREIKALFQKLGTIAICRYLQDNYVSWLSIMALRPIITLHFHPLMTVKTFSFFFFKWSHFHHQFLATHCGEFSQTWHQPAVQKKGKFPAQSRVLHLVKPELRRPVFMRVPAVKQSQTLTTRFQSRKHRQHFKYVAL